MSQKLLTLIAMQLASWSVLEAAAAPPSSRPNVVYIMADELGYYEPGFNGGTNIKTPNLDRMAAEGMRFKNLFAGSSVCAPTRCCLMTGKHSGHSSVRVNGGSKGQTYSHYLIHDAAMKFIREHG